MTIAAKLPSAVYHVVAKHGTADCAVAALAFVLRRSYEEVLIAAARVDPHVWTSGLHATGMSRVCKALGVKARWLKGEIDTEDGIGVLWASYRDSTKEHCVVLLEGWVFDVEHDPVSVWRYDEWCVANNAYGVSLLAVAE